MTKRNIVFAFLIVLLTLAACGRNSETEQEARSSQTSEEEQPSGMAEPERITVQHILIGFEGSIPGKSITRTHEEAEELAKAVLQRAQAGEDFDALVKQYTDDSHPGIYKMTNFGVAADQTERVFSRSGMVKAFGDVGFSLAVGDIGMTSHDPEASRYGWHIIKRIE
ncbi:MAG: peptidyl-prolyl cis-trans isomerase [Candidatus Krumholzibacteria bacterium]|nr:peptidyl-prolyl cis-trans isomerase [Candidatus Krumholzibacteria bacterium]